MRITVFGGSKPRPGEPDYEQARQLGKLLGEAGHTVLTGGYVGTMEAVSSGAAGAGAHVIGVTCDEIEAWRPGGHNRWVQEEIRFPSLRERLYALIEGCDAAVAMPGGVGTLAEVAMMWNLLLTGAITPRPLILAGPGWKAVLDAYLAAFGDFIPLPQREWVSFATDLESVMKQLDQKAEM